jgi:hypothetical protein
MIYKDGRIVLAMDKNGS